MHEAIKFIKSLNMFKNKNNNNKGFTLIELLVVIAIIGILSSVVLASLNTARGKGADASIKANLSGVRAAAELYYDGTSNYDTESSVCTAQLFDEVASIKSAIAAVEAQNTGNVVCRSSDGTATAAQVASSWAISSQLKTGTTDFWCVDSAGASKQTAANITASADTVATLAVCP